MREVLIRLICIATIIVPSYQQIDQQQFCDRYVECAAVATLEERLCLGNSRLRPYWLPDSTDKYGCHVKLRNDYITLEKMEESLDELLMTCLQRNSAPSATATGTCNMRTLQSARQFSYGRTISYIPTHCFTGVQRRIERECGRVRDCCPALSRCSSITTTSSAAERTQELRIQMRKRAENCARGLPITPLPMPVGYNPRIGFDPSSIPGRNMNPPTYDGSQSGYDASTSGDGSGSAYDSGYGNVNVHITPQESSGAYQPEEDVGMISNPVPNREEYERARSRQAQNRQSQGGAEFTEEDGSLTLSAKPKLSFPDDKMQAISTKEGVLVINMHQEHHRGPSSVSSHEKAFEHALQNTNNYKAKMAEQDAGETAREALNSFLRAGQAAEAEKPDGVVSGPIATRKLPSKNAKASGSMRPLEMINDEDVPADGEIVTSPPVIFLGKQINNTKGLHRSGSCIERMMKTQTQKLQQILTLLGEKKDSEDMHEIKELIDEWHNSFRNKVISAKDKTTKLEISIALDNLIKQFDKVNLDLIKSQVNATFDENDYPDGDAAVFETECDPLAVSNILEEQLRHQEQLEKERLAGRHKFDRQSKGQTDEHGDHTVIEDGVTKLILSGSHESLNVDHPATSIEKSSDTSKPTDEEAIIHNWSNKEYKLELEKYKKEHNINATSLEPRNETACDLYMRCRNQMHMAVDSCAWRFANSKILPTLAESAESLLYRAEELCDPAEQPFYEELYELMITRNTRLRDCLDEKNEKFFSTSICLPYSPVEHLLYGSAFIRLLSEDYKQSADCFRDANLIQEKCTKLRECCPNFDSCRQETMDINLEQAIISKTARMNEAKQNCLKSKAREAFKNTLRGILGKGGQEALKTLKREELMHDLKRGAQALARFR
uniref:Clip domain-containing protein n=1 Tax=Haemonchus contortus TaxID=6289 RepID=A0A7I4Y7Q1_HAECO